MNSAGWPWTSLGTSKVGGVASGSRHPEGHTLFCGRHTHRSGAVVVALAGAVGIVDVLIIGAGMHVSGRGTATCGTVLPAVVQAHRDGLIGRMTVAATSAGKIRWCSRSSSVSSPMVTPLGQAWM